MLLFENILFSALIGMACAAVFFAWQLLFALKIKKTGLKLIPTVIISAAALFVAGLVLGIYSTDPTAVNTMKPVALVAALLAGASCIGTFCAWLAYIMFKATDKN